MRICSNSHPTLALAHPAFDRTKSLNNALRKLDERSRAIVQARWLNDTKSETLHNLAKEYKVSAERIRQIEKNALKKIKFLMLPKS